MTMSPISMYSNLGIPSVPAYSPVGQTTQTAQDAQSEQSFDSMLNSIMYGFPGSSMPLTANNWTTPIISQDLYSNLYKDPSKIVRITQSAIDLILSPNYGNIASLANLTVPQGNISVPNLGQNPSPTTILNGTNSITPSIQNNTPYVATATPQDTNYYLGSSLVPSNFAMWA